MNVVAELAAAVPAATRGATRARVPARSVFWALLRRDLRVAQRELIPFLVRSALQPLLFVTVFGYLLPRMAMVDRGYAAALLPGILGITIAFSSIQAVALPMMADFGWTREIEDRLLAPVGIRLVAAEKVVSGVFQGVAAAVFVMPVARLIMGPIPGLTLGHFGELLVITLLGAMAFSSLGLLMGTAIPPQQIGLMFSIIITPMMFFGCAYYPWRGLDVVPVLKYAVLVNPLVYICEGMRGTLTPLMPHMPLGIVLVALAALTVLFWTTGMRSFERRALS